MPGLAQARTHTAIARDPCRANARDLRNIAAAAARSARSSADVSFSPVARRVAPPLWQRTDCTSRHRLFDRECVSAWRLCACTTPRSTVCPVDGVTWRVSAESVMEFARRGARHPRINQPTHPKSLPRAGFAAAERPLSS